MRARSARRTLALLGALAGLAFPHGPLPPTPAHAGRAPAMQVQRFPSAARALEVILRRRPKVIAFGEVHQQKGAEAIPSSLKHFTEELLPVLVKNRQKTTDLILETWITDGNCGKEEKQVVESVQQTTQRPEQTESELVTAIKRAKAGGIDPHILRLSCKEYDSLRERAPDGGLTGDLDFDKLLRLIRRQLMQQLILVLVHRGGATAPGTVLIYGGALHNDLDPRPDDAPYAFGQSAQKAAQGRYLEVDLLVPEYIDAYQAMQKEPWFPIYRREHEGPERSRQVLLIRRGPSSYVVIFARSPAAAPVKPTPAPSGAAPAAPARPASTITTTPP
jgi:hypothetical protein